MKKRLFIIVLACFTQAVFSQTMKIYKTDNTLQEINLSDIDSVKISTSAAGKAITANDFVCITNNNTLAKIGLAAGKFEESEEGIKIYGTSENTSVQIMPTAVNSLMGKSIFLKWKIDGTGNPVKIGVELFNKKDYLISAGEGLSLSTASGIIANNVWYYTRIFITQKEIVSITALDNYDVNGGEIVSSSAVNNGKEINTYSFKTSSGSSSYSVLAEARTE